MNKKKAKGITLIALVVTIIILLLLAGISVQMLTGNNGILTRAEEAKIVYEESEFKTQLELEILGNHDEKMQMNAVELKTNIEAHIKNASVEGNEFPLKVKNTKTNKVYMIHDENEIAIVEYNEEYVARIKSKYYKTLIEAIADVPTDNIQKEIILLKDDNENVSIPTNTKIVLNLNNKKLWSELQTTVISRGTLEIKNGTIQSNEKHAVYNYGTLTINEENTIIKSLSTSVACLVNQDGAELIINNGTVSAEGTHNALYGYQNESITINNGTIISASNAAISSIGNITINGGNCSGKENAVIIRENSNLVINGGSFTAQVNSALHMSSQSNCIINKGIFNSNKTTDANWDGVIHHDSTGSLTIGNIGDNNNNIIINNNNNKISGIFSDTKTTGKTITINSGIINGYNGLNIESKDTKIYLNGGSVTSKNSNGYSVKFWHTSLTNTKLYLKNNSVSLNGHGKTGKNSINYTSYVTEVN